MRDPHRELRPAPSLIALPVPEFVIEWRKVVLVADTTEERCGKCGAEIDLSRRVDFTLKDGTRVCESCFVKGTARPTQRERRP